MAKAHPAGGSHRLPVFGAETARKVLDT
jgi:hypothetical protein